MLSTPIDPHDHWHWLAQAQWQEQVRGRRAAWDCFPGGVLPGCECIVTRRARAVCHGARTRTIHPRTPHGTQRRSTEQSSDAAVQRVLARSIVSAAGASSKVHMLAIGARESEYVCFIC